MSPETTMIAEQCRIQEWAAQIRDCQSRLAGMSVVSWCACHGITKVNQYYGALKTVVYRLNDILDAAWNDVHSDKGKHFGLSVEWMGIVDKYCCWADETGHAPGTIKNKRYAISWFLAELSKLQCCSPGQLSPMLITSACVKITDGNRTL